MLLTCSVYVYLYYLVFSVRSKDDPFVLYAAMYSGLGTKILTRDLMRSQKFLLMDTKIKKVFQKWLQKHRLILNIRPGNHVTINVRIKDIIQISMLKIHFL